MRKSSNNRTAPVVENKIISKEEIKSISISISNKNKIVENESPTNQTQTNISEKQEKEFNEVVLTAAWLEYAASLEKDVHIIKSIEKAIPSSIQNHTFLVKVENALQEKFINDLKSDILSFLRKKLENDKIEFTIQIEKNTIQKPTTIQDRFNEMISKNENFRKLATELSLEI